MESQALRRIRTDYGKQIRKQYENGDIQEKISNMCEWIPRNDGISNTITSVLKDNYIIEYPSNEVAMREIIRVGQVSNEGSQSGSVYSTDGLFSMYYSMHTWLYDNNKLKRRMIT